MVIIEMCRIPFWVFGAREMMRIGGWEMSVDTVDEGIFNTSRMERCATGNRPTILCNVG